MQKVVQYSSQFILLQHVNFLKINTELLWSYDKIQAFIKYIQCSALPPILKCIRLLLQLTVWNVFINSQANKCTQLYKYYNIITLTTSSRTYKFQVSPANHQGAPQTVWNNHPILWCLVRRTAKSPSRQNIYQTENALKIINI